jgi:hypothetical protein
MARIKNNLTGDVFEAPARDFANEADFTIVDSSTPVTAEPPVAVSDTGESGLPASAPVELASSGSTSTRIDIPSLEQVSIQTDASPATTSVSTTDPAPTADSTTDGIEPSAQGDLGNVFSTVTDSGTTPTTESPAAATSDTDTTAATADASASPSTMNTSTAGTDLGNVDASTSLAGAATDATTVADPVTLNPITPPVTDSVTGNPTGGPTAGNGATLDAKGKHIVANQLESDMLFAIAQIITPTASIKHAADAFFDQVRSQIDIEAEGFV